MKCPFCSGEMEAGLLQSGQIMVWVKKKHLVSLLPKDGEVLIDRRYMSNCAVPAWICKKCEKVILDYSEKRVEEL